MAARPAKHHAFVTASARDRLVAAAADVFAREGLAAAGTRRIAAAAGVNEVTLFRLFKSKSNLLAAVLDRVFTLPGDGLPVPAPDPDAPLPDIVREFAVSYAARLDRNPRLARVLIGEIQHFKEHELQVMRRIFLPEKLRLADRLRAAQKQGRVRKDILPAMVGDQVKALIFMGRLRSALPRKPGYSDKRYLDSCVATIVRGIEA